MNLSANHQSEKNKGKNLRGSYFHKTAESETGEKDRVGFHHVLSFSSDEVI